MHRRLSRSIYYSFLYHRAILIPGLLLIAVLLYPIYAGGLAVLPVTTIGKAAIAVLLIYLHFRRMDARSLFFQNLNFRIRDLHAVYFTIDVVTYITCSVVILSLRW